MAVTMVAVAEPPALKRSLARRSCGYTFLAWTKMKSAMPTIAKPEVATLERVREYSCNTMASTYRSYSNTIREKTPCWASSQGKQFICKAQGSHSVTFTMIQVY
jgi:hypothetical protein